jgi:uncharacterized protein
MAQERIDYGNMMHRAMRSLISEVLKRISKEGLPGAHHFFITFDTQHENVELSDWLRTRYPEEMTIVIQHWFDALEVTKDAFSITLNFGDQPEHLKVPLDSIRTFVDPSVEFGLRFETQDDEDDAVVADEPAGETTEDEAKTTTEHKDADVVSLDSFRKP